MCAIIPQFAKGFSEDATRIVFKYKNSPESSFKCFSDIWKEMKFAQIFTGRRTAAEVMEISEEYLDIAKYFSIYIDDPKIKIGGLFLLYSLYYSQPLENFAKIRLLLSEWLHLKNWWLTLDKNKDDEPIYMFLKLYYDNAFKFVFENYYYGLDKCFYKHFKEFPNTVMMPYHIVNETYCIKPEERNELKELTEELASLGVEYTKIRQKLNFQMKLNCNIPGVLSSLFDEPTTVTKQTTSEDGKTGSEDETDVNEELGKKRKAIKQKAFGAESTGRYLQNLSNDQNKSSSEYDLSEQEMDVDE